MRRPLITSWRELWEHRLQNWVARHSSDRIGGRRHRRRVARRGLAEQLETRCLLSAIYASVDVGQQIPDQGQLVSTLNVPDSVSIGDLNVTLDIGHGRDQDLDVFLISPGGTRVELMTDVGGGGDNFSGTTLDDEAATPITAGSAPFFGSFQPEGVLSDLDGEGAQGDWTLEINDDKRRETGTLIGWSIEVTPAQPSLPPNVTISDMTVTEGDDPVQFVEAFISAGSGGLDNPVGMLMGSDGNLYVTSEITHEVLRYDGATGAFLGAFVTAGSGGLSKPRVMVFGPGDDLYVGSTDTDSVLRYQGPGGASPGALIEEFVPSGYGGLDNPRGLAFDSAGNLYVSNRQADEVLRYDGATGAFLGAFVTAGSGGLDQPGALVFGPDDNLYVTSISTDSVLRYDGTTGAALGSFVSSGSGGLLTPHQLIFGPDNNLYVSSAGQDDAVLRFQGPGSVSPGAFVDEFVPSGSGSLNGPRQLVFHPDGSLLVTSLGTDEILQYRAPSQSVFTVSLSSPSALPVTVDYSTADGTAIVGSDYTATSGTVVFAPGETSKTVLIPILDDALPEGDETFDVVLSNAVGGNIVDTIGVATIVDDEAFRQISIDDVTVIEGDNTPRYRGAFVDGLPGGHFNPLTFGPDGYVYTAVGTGIGYNSVQRYDAETGEFVDTFISNNEVDPKINGVRDIVFHPTDGYVYVASAYTDEVLRYDAQTGDFFDVFVSAGSGGIDHPDGMMFGPDANSDGLPELYVTGWLSHSVMRYDGATGLPLGTYIASGSGGLSYPFSLAFQSGSVFVTSAGTNEILKYDAATGASQGAVVSSGLNYPRGLTFGPDGLMYVTSGNDDRIVRFTESGQYVDDYVPAGTAGLDDPRTPRFGPDGDLYVTVTGLNEIMRFGTQSKAVMTVSMSTASNLPVTVDFATGDGSAAAGFDYATTSGTLTFAPGETSKTVLVLVLDDALEEVAETFDVVLSNAAGGNIVDTVGVGTIIDDDTLPPEETVVFEDSFEDGEWNGKWVEDSQNDWARKTQRATDGNYSAEVDGSATNATLTTTDSFDLIGFTDATLTFSWYIESGFDAGEFLAFDVSLDGGTTWQTDILRLDGNVDAENTWHHETVDLAPYVSSNFRFRFRSSVSRSNEDANVDNVRLVANSEVAFSSSLLEEEEETSILPDNALPA